MFLSFSFVEDDYSNKIVLRNFSANKVVHEKLLGAMGTINQTLSCWSWEKHKIYSSSHLKRKHILNTTHC